MDAFHINQTYTSIINKMVLKALALGMTREEAVEYILQGCQDQASDPGMDKRVAGKLLAIDPAAINRVLKAAGF